MRFQITREFGKAWSAQQAASKAANEYPGEMEDPEFEALMAAEQSAIDNMMLAAPALTPTEISEKIKLYAERDMGHRDGAEEYLDAIRRDLVLQQRWSLGDDMNRRWTAWRNLEEILGTEMSAEDEKFHSDLHAQAYCEIAMAHCTTPGDFILKQYLRLLTEHGHTLHGQAREDMTGNPWDIDIDDHTGEARFETADKLGCYDDIDSTDLGMNLLAYGLPYFDAEAWMEAADRTGLKVDLCVQHDGREGLSISMLDRNFLGIQEDNDDTPETPVSQRIKRERDRLRRLLANVCAQRGPDGGRDRYRMVADEIRAEWPQLVWRAPPIVPAPARAQEPAA